MKNADADRAAEGKYGTKRGMQGMKGLRRTISLLLAVLLLFGICAQGCFAVETRTIRVGYIDYTGFIELQDSGNYSGYAVQYLNEIAKYTGWSYEYIHGDWAELMQRLADGEIDLLCQAQKSSEREETYLFSKYSDGSESNVLYTSMQNDTLFYNGYEDFDGITVAMMEGSFQNESFAAFADKKGFAFTPAYFGSEDECFAALKDGTADAVAMGSLAKRTGYKVLCRFGSDPFYFITGKQNQQMMEQLDDAMEEILGIDPYFSMKLYDSYYGAETGEALNLTKDELAYIQTAGVITVGQLRNRYAISSVDPDTGELVGINEDILALLAEATGLKFQSVAVSPDTKPVDALRNGDFEMVMGILRTENFLSDPTLQVSSSYLDSTLTAVMRKGETYDSKQTYTVALKTSFQAMQEYISANYPQYQTEYYSDDDECLRALLSGEADLMLQNVYTMNYLMQKPQYASLEMLPTTFLTEHNCIATLSDTDPRLISILDKAIAALDAEQINSAILANTTAKPYQLTLLDVLYKYHVQILICAVLLLFCFILLGSIMAVRKKKRDDFAGEERAAGRGCRAGGSRQHGQKSVFVADEP